MIIDTGQFQAITGRLAAIEAQLAEERRMVELVRIAAYEDRRAEETGRPRPRPRHLRAVE
jgi:hypothetical protein